MKLSAGQIKFAISALICAIAVSYGAIGLIFSEHEVEAIKYVPDKWLEYAIDKEPDIGEIWRWKNENPFSKYKIVDSIIIDKKSGYVKFIDVDDGRVSSGSVGGFVMIRKRIK